MDENTKTALIVLGVVASAIGLFCCLYKYCCTNSRVSYSVISGSRQLRAQQDGERLKILASGSVMDNVVKGNKRAVLEAAVSALDKVDRKAEQDNLEVHIDLNSLLLGKSGSKR